MVLDTSAVIAILQNEPDSDALVAAMANADIIRISAASIVDAGIIIHARFGDAGEMELDQFIHRLGISVIPVTPEQADIARTAYRKFGKGQDPAGLNFGDCFSYALSTSLHEPLLFTGNDFSKTDLQVVDY